MAAPNIISSFQTLKDQIENHMVRSDVSDEGVAEMVIDMAEARFNREIRHPKRITRNDSFTVDSQYETVPTDFWAVKRFALNTSPTQHLEYITPEEMAYKRQGISSSGRPIYYTVTGGNFEFLPSPGSSYTGLLVYEKEIPALDATTTTNWLIDDHPDVYLYGCMAEAEAWAQNYEGVAFWEARLARALDELRISGEREALGSTPIARARPFGRGVLRGQ